MSPRKDRIMHKLRQRILARRVFYGYGMSDDLLRVLKNPDISVLGHEKAEIITKTTVDIPLVEVYNFDAFENRLGHEGGCQDHELDEMILENLCSELLEVLTRKDEYPTLMPHLPEEDDWMGVARRDKEKYFDNAKKVRKAIREVVLNREYKEKDGWKIIYKSEVEY